MRFVAIGSGMAGARRLFACSASVAALALASTPAWAESPPAEAGDPAPNPQANADASQDTSATTTADTAAPTDDNAIVVTGSRLITTTMNTPQPVTAVAADQLDAMDPSSLIASVSQLPQFYGNTTPNNSAFFVRGGTGNLNMRGLGANRTLTLLNGRRFPSSSAFGGVDINLFPEAMVSSVETVTGGASAAYGTDAVAGVVNFKLNTKFEGLTVDAQAGQTDRGDAQSYQVNAAAGLRLGDRGHLLLAGTVAHQAGVHTYKGRGWYQSWGSLLDQSGMWRIYPDVVSNVGSFDGVIFAPGTAINGLQFNADGTYQPFVRGSAINYIPGKDAQGNPTYVATTLGTGTSASSGGSGDDLGGQFGEPFTIWPKTDRYSAFAYADYEITPGLTFFAQYVRGYNKQFQYNTPRGSLFGSPTAITIFQNNAFLPDALRQTMVANNIASFSLRRTGSIEDIGQMRLNDATTQNVGTAGFDATIHNDGFLANWQVHGFYQYGRSQRVWDQVGLRIDRIFAAVDAVKDANGNIVCNVSLNPAGAAAFPGCKPLNLFGRGNASPDAVDWVIGNDVGQHVDAPLYFANLGYTGETLSYDAIEPKRNITTFTQNLAEVSANGDLFDGWAGPITLALGASYRKESIRQVVQDTTNQSANFDGAYHPCSLATGPALGLRGLSPPDCGNTVGVQFSKVSNIKGSTDVKEAFAETLIPLADNWSWMKHAALDIAGRWADYSGAGAVWAYKAGLDLGFSDAIRLRGTYSRDVRAGNLSERFDKTGGVGNVTDPRSLSSNPNGGSTYQITIFSGGNPNIKPEKADTFTAGVVLEPGFIPGLSLSVDWYKVKIKDAISTVGVNEVAKRCLIDQDPTFCQLVTTDPTQNDKIILVGNQYVNVAQSQVEGIDGEIDYHRDVKLFGGAPERISARVFASYLLNRCDTGAPTAATPNPTPTCIDGLTGINPSNGAPGLFPKFKATGNFTYNNGPFTWFTQVRYIGKGKNAFTLAGLTGAAQGVPLIGGVPAAVEGVNIQDNSVPAVIYVDMRFDYMFEVGNSSVDVFASVTNLFDRDPPITPTYGSFGGYTTQYNAGLFDVLGRRFTIGAKFKL
jgi:outer membrane receptor protein involved in Fe transport